MKVSGFAIARNVLKADYPIGESLKSIEPLCDEIVVAIGNSDDDTRSFIANLGLKNLKIIDTIWDDNLRVGGKVLADETNKALENVSKESDWCFYIQADECIHEDDLPIIQKALIDYKDDNRVDGLLFRYRHFYGSYDYLGDSRRWYRNEIRIIKNTGNFKSWKDAQGFRTKNDEKLNVMPIEARIFHYGWVKHPKDQQVKQEQFHRLWHDDKYMNKHVYQRNEFNYSEIDSLTRFNETHPSIMKERIERINWNFDFDVSKKNFNFKSFILYWIEKITGKRIGEYRNYILLKL